MVAIEKKNGNEMQKVAGGANKGKLNDKYLFWCEKCGHKWTGNDKPEDVHGCPSCGWWFESLKDNGNWKKECIKYKKI